MTEPKPKIERKDPDALCENCSWRERSGFVGGGGPIDADLLVVGEAPGRVEVDTGIPFTGPSGQLLDKVFGHFGIDREETRYTNVVACHPPFGSGSATTPPKDVIACCRPRLQRELRGHKQILTLGNTAKQAVLSTSEAITKVRVGPPKKLTLPDGEVEVVPTVHPAFCLRTSDAFPSLVKDVAKLKNTQLFLGWEPPEYEVALTENEALRAIIKLHRYGMLAIDIETDVEKDDTFTHPRDILCAAIAYAPNKAIVFGMECLRFASVVARLRELLRAKPSLCHNGRYDLQVFMRFGILTAPGLNLDTMLANYVLDERPGQHSLDNLASELLGAPNWKAEIKPFTKGGKSYANIPKDLLHKYCAYDAVQTFNAWPILEERMEKQGLRRVHDMLVEFSNELVYVEYDGLNIDLSYLGELEVEYQALIQKLDNDLLPWVGNPRSWQQVGAVMAAMGLNAPDTTAKTLKGLYATTTGEQHEFFRLMLESRSAGKMYGTYVKGIRQRLIDGKVYPSYLLHGTVFGRLAARNPNIHNVPRGKKLRRMYIPGEGNIYVQCDYSQAELRVIATEARDEYLRGVFNDTTRDIHNEVSDTLYGPGNWGKEQRVRTKAFVFGSAYGREPYSIAQEFGLKSYEAENLQQGFFGMIPDTMRWRQEQQDLVFKHGKALQTCFGRKRRFHLITRENQMDISKEALAFKPQSISSDICLHALCRIRKHFGWSEHSPKIKITVHDSILVECKPEEATEVGQDMSRIMRETAAEVYDDFVPFEADAERGRSWGELTEEDNG